MPSMFCDYLEIDAADIWRYESNLFLERKGGLSLENLSELYDELQGVFLASKIKPFVTLHQYLKKEIDGHYYERHIQEQINWKKKGIPLEFFVAKENLYSMNEPCIVDLNNHNREVFEKLFALKLRQYGTKLSQIPGFLTFQLSGNFQDNVAKYKEFIKFLLLQHEELIEKKVSSVVKAAIEEIETKLIQEPIIETGLLSQEATELTTSVPETNSTPSEPIPEPIDSVTIEEIETKPNQEPEIIPIPIVPITELNENATNGGGVLDDENFTRDECKIIEGNYNVSEILQYFSFLYLELSVGGEPFLKKNDVAEIFRYGIAIPPRPLKKKFKLNISKRHPKRYVEDAIHFFILKDSYSKMDKLNYLRFFASYIEDFSTALESDEKLISWSKNITGNKSKKKSFDHKKYLPKPIRESTLESTRESTPESTPESTI